MNFSVTESLAKKLDFDNNNMKIEFTDGRILMVPLAYFPKLLNATKEQKYSYVISGGGSGLHWDEIDEDISVENLLYGFGDTTNINKNKSSSDAA